MNAAETKVEAGLHGWVSDPWAAGRRRCLVAAALLAGLTGLASHGSAARAADLPIFADDFETGFSCAWSLTDPTPGTCVNAQLDGCETDVDCGGRQCAACANSLSCLVGSDCQSGLCALDICVECILADDCPGSDTECQARTCNSGVCGLAFTAEGTILAEQTAGDCQTRVCDGAGGESDVADDGDLPADDGNECTAEVCVAGVASLLPVDAGVSCSQGGGSVCDGAGNCVACLVANDCPGSDTECEVRTCEANSCGVLFLPGATCGDGGICDAFGACHFP